jgi:hypothetical protein
MHPFLMMSLYTCFLQVCKYTRELVLENLFCVMILCGCQAVDDSVLLKDIMCGDEAAAARHCLEISYPVSRRKLAPCCWEYMMLFHVICHSK